VSTNDNQTLSLKTKDNIRPLDRKADPIALAGGASGVIVMITALLLLPIIAKAGADREENDDASEAFEYIEARLLKFGEEKDDTKLPDRIVPAMPTAPDEILPLDANENKPPPPKKKPEQQKQPDAVSDDKLREVFDKARAFAEIQDDYIPEGHLDGVPDGEVTDRALASMGATYGRRLKRLFLDRWIVPTLLSKSQLDSLKVKVNIKIDADMMIVGIRFLKKSGNAMFDDSVKNAIDRVRADIKTLPAPPEAIAPKIFGAGINLTFNGKEAVYK